MCSNIRALVVDNARTLLQHLPRRGGEPGRSLVRWRRMIEAMMYVAIGLLLGGLVAIAVVPLIHKRAVRLTERRLEAALPQSMKEIQAYKDGLRADFALSARRLEIRNERLVEQAAPQLAMLSKKDDTIRALRAQIETMRAEATAKGQVGLLRGGNAARQLPPAKSAAERPRMVRAG